MRVLGVDPGLTRCGLGVVDGGPGRTVRCVDVGVARTPADDDLAHRLLALSTPLGEDVLLLAGFTGGESMSRLFTYSLDLLSEEVPHSIAVVVEHMEDVDGVLNVDVTIFTK